MSNLCKVIKHLSIACCLSVMTIEMISAAPKAVSGKEEVERLVENAKRAIKQITTLDPRNEYVTNEQRRDLVMSVGHVVAPTRADRDSAPGQNDRQSPVSSLIDLAEISSCLCAIKLMLASGDAPCLDLKINTEDVIEVQNATTVEEVAGYVASRELTPCDLLVLIAFNTK